jgi:hypothetical protein
VRCSGLLPGQCRLLPGPQLPLGGWCLQLPSGDAHTHSCNVAAPPHRVYNVTMDGLEKVVPVRGARSCDGAFGWRGRGGWGVCEDLVGFPLTALSLFDIHRCITHRAMSSVDAISQRLYTSAVGTCRDAWSKRWAAGALGTGQPVGSGGGDGALFHTESTHVHCPLPAHTCPSLPLPRLELPAAPHPSPL